MNDESLLLKLSNVAMNRVLHHCEYPVFASLRKTCRSLREFVDTEKPDARMVEVDISCDANRVIFRLQSGERRINILYKNDEEGCYPRRFTGWEDNLASNGLNGMDYIEMFKNDFTVFLRHQRSVLKQMVLHSDGKTAGVPALQVLLAISSVDAHNLRILTTCIREPNVSLEEISETKQWGQLDICHFGGFRLLEIRPISHLKTFSGFVTVVTAGDLDYLKAAFLNSLNFSHCTMKHNSVANLSEITETFGVQPFTRDCNFGGVSRLWFFRLPNDKSRVLALDVHSDNHVEFEQIETAKVPSDAVIIGCDSFFYSHA
ncbi:hypothetical protein GCK72_021403 [Caenorhabditis remanei]|uniref:DUF38 domain-containing protein n=1 Tax=Caenorhabditis remanei TaxID=31234 RepID=A0A6A5GI20_CAERE|nr:hypothetical protein GCK72_021403 [Caenorhabditis remanei]KAF1754838.1 hypothetical protein GCK72_021403 [Caenorhabditis remanei]